RSEAALLTKDRPKMGHCAGCERSRVDVRAFAGVLLERDLAAMILKAAGRKRVRRFRPPNPAQRGGRWVEPGVSLHRKRCLMCPPNTSRLLVRSRPQRSSKPN